MHIDLSNSEVCAFSGFLPIIVIGECFHESSFRELPSEIRSYPTITKAKELNVSGDTTGLAIIYLEQGEISSDAIDFIASLQSRSILIFLQEEGVYNREEIEGIFIERGFRKHPLYFRTADYSELDEKLGTIGVALEKAPPDAAKAYPLRDLRDERDLHMDMTREAGSRSDAHMIRYFEAAKYIRPGDVVFDAACGLGYGSHILWHNSQAARICGIDNSDYAIDYATKFFGSKTVTFEKGNLPEALRCFGDSTIDFIASFETVEHLDDPNEFLEECRRVLRPSGRIVISVPNDWADEDGEDPNPHHLHVFTWESIQSLIEKRFLIEWNIAQDANRKKTEHGWVKATRSLRYISTPEASEWCLMMGSKDPLRSEACEYEERAFGELPPTLPTELDIAGQYENPWLFRSLITRGFRINNTSVLASHSRDVLSSSLSVIDRSAALCALAYDTLSAPREAVLSRILEIEICLDELSMLMSPISIRWRASLSYVQALLNLKIDEVDAAILSFKVCIALPFLDYSPLLATKSVEAAFRVGWLSCGKKQLSHAKKYFQVGVELSREALQAAQKYEFSSGYSPDFFNREMAQVSDLAVRCHTAINLISQLDDRPSIAERVLLNLSYSYNTSHLEKLKWERRALKNNQLLEMQAGQLKKMQIQLEQMRAVILTARRSPIKLLKEKILFKVTHALSKASPPLSARAASRFARSARKRDPRREDILNSIGGIKNSLPINAILSDISNVEPLAIKALSKQRENILVVSSLPQLQGYIGNWKKLFQDMPDNIQHFIFVPWLVKGGADLVAINCLKAAMNSTDGSSVLIATDYDKDDAREWLPEGAHFVSFSDYGEFTREERISLVRHLIFAFQPNTVLNVNSRALWDAIVRHGVSLSNYTNVYAYLFCRDYRSDGVAAGYADTHLRDGVLSLKGVFFDNEIFRTEMVNELALPQDQERKFSVVWQPTSSKTKVANIHNSGGPKVLWAGRFVRQKNVELLISIIEIMKHVVFTVYGSGEPNLERLLRDAAKRNRNLILKGTFSSFEELKTNDYSALLFTSRYEGLPTTLIIAGSMGIPIVATCVGGVGDLIDDETGWPIDSLDDPAAYVQAIDDILDAPSLAQEKVERLRNRIDERHNWRSFTQSLEEAGFLQSKVRKYDD